MKFSKNFLSILSLGSLNIVKTRVHILLEVWLWGECAFSMCPGFCPQHPKSKAEKDKCAVLTAKTYIVGYPCSAPTMCAAEPGAIVGTVPAYVLGTPRFNAAQSFPM